MAWSFMAKCISELNRALRHAQCAGMPFEIECKQLASQTHNTLHYPRIDWALENCTLCTLTLGQTLMSAFEKRILWLEWYYVWYRYIKKDILGVDLSGCVPIGWLCFHQPLCFHQGLGLQRQHPYSEHVFTPTLTIGCTHYTGIR